MTQYKLLTLLAIVPLFTIGLTTGYVDEALATNTSTTGGVGATKVKAFGSTGQTCGQGSCAGTIGGKRGGIDETKMESIEGGPFVKISQVQKASANSDSLYKVTYAVFAGDKDVVDVFVLIKSDKTTESSEIAGISAKASSTTSTLITASDPSSINVDVLRWNNNF